MTAPDNPFAGLTAMRDLLTADPAPAAVVAAPSPGENPFATLTQPPPLAPSASGASQLNEPACGGAPAQQPVPEAPAAVDATVQEPADVPETPAEEPKPKRRPGRPRKKPVEDAPASAMSTPKDRATYLRDIAATEAPATAFTKLTSEVTFLEETRDALTDSVDSITSRIEEFNSSRIRVTAQIEELTKFLETLDEQTAPLQSEVATKTAELSTVEEELTVAVESLDRVRDFITALSGGKSGTIGGVRVTVLDGTTHIETL